MGLQVWPVKSAVLGRKALREAMEAYPALAQSVAAAHPVVMPVPAPALPSSFAAPAAPPLPTPAIGSPGLGVAAPALPNGDVGDEEVVQQVRLALGRRGANRSQICQDAVAILNDRLRCSWACALATLDDAHSAARVGARDAALRLAEQRRVEDGDSAFANSIRKSEEERAIAALTVTAQEAKEDFHVADVIKQRADHRVIRGDGCAQALRDVMADKQAARDARVAALQRLRVAWRTRTTVSQALLRLGQSLISGSMRPT